MKQIIAIGGGGFGRPGCELHLEKYILKQCSAENPKIGFLPQASCEEPYYINRYYQAFLSLKAQPCHISLFGRVEDTLHNQLLEQDIIYVGGGNTKSMLALWRDWGVDKTLKKAYEQGTILCGVSAGAICWFEQAVTDSVWPLGILDCLGFISGSCCPHFDSEPERPGAFKHYLETGQVKAGIALQDLTAAHYVDGKLKQIIKTDASKEAFFVSKESKTTLETVFVG